MTRILVLLVTALAVAACDPKPATIRTLALSWVAQSQVQQGDIEGAKETATLARLTADLAGELEFEWGDSGPLLFGIQSSWAMQYAAPALAWAGDGAGAEHVAANEQSLGLQLSALAGVALAHGRAGHGQETARIADMLVKANYSLSQVAALALAWSGDVAAARELAMQAAQSRNDWVGVSLVALAQAQTGDLEGGRATADSMPSEGEGEAIESLPYLIFQGVGLRDFVEYAFPFFGNITQGTGSTRLTPRVQALTWVAWLQAARGNSEGAIATAELIGPAAERAIALGLAALAVPASADDNATARAIETARTLAKEISEGTVLAYLDALLRAASGDISGALEQSKKITEAYGGALRLQILVSLARSGDVAAALQVAADEDEGPLRALLIGAVSAMAAQSGRPVSNEITAGFDPIRYPPDPENLWLPWLYEAFTVSARANQTDIAGALATATTIAGQRTREAALRMASVAHAVAGDLASAEQTIQNLEEHDEGLRGRVARDALLALGETGGVGEAIEAERAPGIFGDNVDILARIATARAKLGDDAGARAAADAAAASASETSGGNSEFAVRWAAVAKAAAGDMSAAVTLLKNKGAMPGWFDNPAQARLAAGGAGVIEDTAMLAAYLSEATSDARGQVLSKCSFSQLLARLGARDRARSMALQAYGSAKPILADMGPTELACLASALLLAGEGDEAEDIVERSAETTETEEDPESRDGFRVTVSGVLARADRLQDALDMADRTVAPAERAYAVEEIALALADIGRLEEAFEVLTHLSDLEERIWALSEIARRRSFADPSGAQQAATLAAETATALIDVHARIVALRDVVKLQIELGQASAAGRSAVMALDDAERVRMPELRALCLGVAAEALTLAGRRDDAQAAIRVGAEAASEIFAGFYRALALSQLARAQAVAGSRSDALAMVKLAHAAALSIPTEP